MSNWFVSSVKFAALSQWAATTAYTVGQLVKATGSASATAQTRVYRCSTAGTTAGTEPAWNTTVASTTTSGTAVFTQCSGQEAYGWAAAAPNINTITLNNISKGDMVWVDSAHAEAGTVAVDVTIIADGVVSVDSAGAFPPTIADYLAGASVHVNHATNTLTIREGYYRGIAFRTGTGTTLGSIIMRSSAVCMFEDCSFRLDGTSGTPKITCGTGTLDGATEFINCTFRFGAIGQGIVAQRGDLLIRDTTSTPLIDSAGTMPTNFINHTTGASCNIVVRNCDLSNLTSSLNSMAYNYILIENCLLHANHNAVSFSSFGALASAFPIHRPVMVMRNCDDATGAAARSGRLLIFDHIGKMWREEFGRVGGANDGQDPYSLHHSTNTTTGVNTYMPVKFPVIHRRFTDVGVAKTVTLYAVYWKAATVAKANDLYCEIEVLEDAGHTMATRYSSRANVFDTSSLTADTSDWTAGTLPLRGNATAYVAGNMFKVASNPGRIFRFETSSGTSAGSEPAGYASAVDGGTITDGGGSTVRAGTRVKFVFNGVTAGRRGFLRAQFHDEIGASIAIGSVLFDPFIEVT